MKRSTLHRAVTVLLAAGLLALTGCGAIVGDSCEVDTDCGTGLSCDTTLPDGYCTLGDCARFGCSDEGVCVRFDAYTSFCMAPCTSAGDCRDDYECIGGQGPHDFCGLVAD
jgi:hypothetical protein